MNLCRVTDLSPASCPFRRFALNNRKSAPYAARVCICIRIIRTSKLLLSPRIGPSLKALRGTVGALTKKCRQKSRTCVRDFCVKAAVTTKKLFAAHQGSRGWSSFRAALVRRHRVRAVCSRFPARRKDGLQSHFLDAAQIAQNAFPIVPGKAILAALFAERMIQ